MSKTNKIFYSTQILPSKKKKQPPPKKKKKTFGHSKSDDGNPTGTEAPSLFGFSLAVCKPSKELGVALSCGIFSPHYTPWS